MNKNDIKSIWKLARFTWIGSFCLWIVESIIFMIIEGWHIKATNPIEVYCDKIVNQLWNVALWITAYCALHLLINLKSRK